MGRIKTTLIKRATKKLMKLHGERFNDKFEDDKKVVNEVASIPSKKLRNSIAGFLARIKKKEKEKE